jgi:hypothetical protein
VDACNPLLQAHPTWARDKNTKAAGFPPPSLAPAALSSPLRAPSRADPSRLGHAATFHSSAQGPPGLEMPTNILHRSGLPYNLDLGLYSWSEVFCWCPKFYKIYLFSNYRTFLYVTLLEML